MIILNDHLKNKKSMADFVRECDAAYWTQVDGAIDRIVNTKNLKFLTLSGPTCAGKTTTSKAITDRLKKYNINVKLISIDDFFFDRDNNLKIDGKADFDTVKAIDLDLFAKCVKGIHDGESVLLPSFDFITGKRAGYTEFLRTNHDIILFEGIQAVYPEITSLLSSEDYLSIFTNVNEDVLVGEYVFSPREMRLCRRLVRDAKFRSAPAYATFEMWKNVADNEDKNIFPYAQSDIMIDTTLIYQFGVLKPYLSSLFNSSETNDAEALKKFKDIIDRHACIEEIPSEFVPKNSVFREFIG